MGPLFIHHKTMASKLGEGVSSDAGAVLPCEIPLSSTALKTSTISYHFHIPGRPDFLEGRGTRRNYLTGHGK